MDSAEYEHRCASIPGDNIHVYRSDDFLQSEIWEWCLVVQRSADESDLEENHYLEEVGDIIWQTVVGISHCPFCGVPLKKGNYHSDPREAEFRHIDSSGWSSRVL